jgi:hypothetical protein
MPMIRMVVMVVVFGHVAVTVMANARAAAALCKLL